MEKLIMIGQFLLGLFIMVGLHELGHLLFAKLFGMRVESYTIGFPPQLCSFKWGETEYSIGILPLGGAVKVTGIVDESLDTVDLDKGPQPWDYRAKPTWQRLIFILGGIIFNVISGIIIYIAITFFVGDSYFSKNDVNQHGIVPNALGRTIGFQEGDKIIKINGDDFDNFTDIMASSIIFSEGSFYTVIRNGEVLQLFIPPNLIEQLSEGKGKEAMFVKPLIPFKVGALQPGGGGEKGGLQPGDNITTVGGQAVTYLHQFVHVLQKYINQEVPITYHRDGMTHNTTVFVDNNGKIGLNVVSMLISKHLKYSFLESILVGTKKAFGIVKVSILAFGKVFMGKISASKSLSGPIGIAQLFGEEFHWSRFWNVVGMLSMVIAFTNLLPIPALDGGHAVLILYEMVTRHKLSVKFLETVQKIGVAILLILTTYVIFNDLYKLL